MTAPNLTERVTLAIDRYVYAGGTHGPADAATRVLADPELADALAAVQALDRIVNLHQPREWSGGIAVVCAHCEKAFPCPTVEAMT